MSGHPPLDVETTPEGEQCLMPGVAPIRECDRLAAFMAAPLRPRKAQKPLDIGLFDGEADQTKVRWTFVPPNARNQLSLF